MVGKNERGSAMLEFTLVGVPLIFILICTFELARAMWNYHTVAYAINEATRYAAVRGKGCTYTGNSCSVTVGTVARQIASFGIGLDSGTFNVTLTSGAGDVPCQPLSSCFNNATVWPPKGAADAGMDITIRGSYPFQSALTMFWPGKGALSVGALALPSTSRQVVQF
jgi:hypothetical protein